MSFISKISRCHLVSALALTESPKEADVSANEGLRIDGGCLGGVRGGRRSAQSKRLVGRISHCGTAEINWQSFWGWGAFRSPIQDDDFEIPHKEKLIPYVLWGGAYCSGFN